MDQVIRPPRSIRGTITVPGDKSVSHRAVMLNAIAEGVAEISNFSPGADCMSTLECMRALGANVTFGTQPSSLSIRGAGLRGLREAQTVLDAGNSGTTMRLMTGLLSGQSFFSVITGDRSLRTRPMARVIKPLRLMGAQIWGRDGDSLAPLAIKGSPLHGIEYRLPVASAQVKSALLLAALLAEGPTMLEEPALSRDHTERMLTAMGADLKQAGTRVTLKPTPGPLRAIDVAVPGDISSAAFWLVAGAIHPNARVVVQGVGVNPTRSGIIEVLKKMGARISVENERQGGGEPVADVIVESSALKGVSIGGDIVPSVIDEIPVIAVAAAVAQGDTRISGAEELRVKESDRIAGMAHELAKFGASVEEQPDGMMIHGVREVHGAHCDSYGDHRLAMAFAVLGLVASGETIVHDSESVAISYPAFWQQLERLGQ